ncbi:hypothetical protein B484DRAFT_432650, partial [Ochromonadaceae sp. CCMP2298]
MNPDLRDAIQHNEKIKYTIAEYDSAMLDREFTKVFKKHGKIISTLTSRTKTQNRRTLTIKNKNPEDIYKIVGGNNNYSKFMKLIFMSKHAIEMEMLRTARPSDLYEEELLINILGTSNTNEIKHFDALYTKDRSTSLLDTFNSKLKPGSQLQKFIELIFKYERDESKAVDEALASVQATEIHKAGAARLQGADEDAIFAILSKASRTQCHAIMDVYLTLFNIKFERAINMKFKGNCGKLLLFWAQPLPSAVASCLYAYQDRMMIDKLAVVSMVAKYEKDFLAQVDIQTEKLFEKNLVDLVDRGLSGNILQAITAYVNNHTPDKGFERIMELFLDTQQTQGRTLEELLKRDDFQARLLFLQKKECEELEKFMKENRIKFNPDDKLDLASLSMESFLGDVPSKGVAAVVTKASPLNRMSIKQEVSVQGEGEYDRKIEAIQGYLQTFFQSKDLKDEGSFDVDDFWAYLGQLPADDLGFGDGGFEAMRGFAEWETDGRVYYHELLFELSDSVLAAIEGKSEGEMDVLTVVSKLQNQEHLDKVSRIKSERKIMRSKSVPAVNNVPDYFLQYLYDTLLAFDFDANGFLEREELQSLLPVMNMEMQVSDFLDTDDVSMSHKEAAQVMARHVSAWFEDRSEDHFICLVDKDSGVYFWFNTKDESTQWVDDGQVEGWSGQERRLSSAVITGSPVFAEEMPAIEEGVKEAPRSPRAPTAADEKESEALAAAAFGDDDAGAKEGEELVEAAEEKWPEEVVEAAEEKGAEGAIEAAEEKWPEE